MDVLLIGKYFYPHPGGIERYTCDLVNNLSNKRDIKTLDCLVASSSSKFQIKKLLKGKLFEGGTILTVFSTPISLYYFFHIKKYKYDIIHMHLPNPLAVLAFLFVQPKSKLILHFHAVHSKYEILDKIFYYFFMNRICEKSRVIIFSSPKIIEELSFFKKYENKITFVSYGIDFNYWNYSSNDEIAAVKEGHKKDVVLYVGRFTHYKGIEYLVDSAKYVNADFILIGDGNSMSKFKEASKNNENIFFIGRVSDSVLKSYYYASDIVVLPSTSYSETFGIVQLEAMACGKPVIVTQIKGSAISEPIEKGAYGLIIMPNSVEDLVKGINVLLKECKFEINKKKAMGNKNIIKEHYSIDEAADKILKIYGDVLNEKSTC